MRSKERLVELNGRMERGMATVPEVAEYFGVARSTVYKWIDLGHLNVVRIGRTTRVPWSVVYDLAADRLTGKGPQAG